MVSRNELLGQIRQEDILPPEDSKEEGSTFASWLYHEHKAPQGELFNDEGEYKEALESGWVDTPAKFGHRTAESRQQQIEKEWEEAFEEVPEIIGSEEGFNRDEYLIYLRRVISGGLKDKQLYHYTMEEMVEVYNKLELPIDESLSRIELYKELKSYVELNT